MCSRVFQLVEAAVTQCRSAFKFSHEKNSEEKKDIKYNLVWLGLFFFGNFPTYKNANTLLDRQ